MGVTGSNPDRSLLINSWDTYSQTRSSVPVANKLMNSLMENDFVC